MTGPTRAATSAPNPGSAGSAPLAYLWGDDAYGLEADSVVIVHALEMENLDLNEFQAVIDDMSMAVAKHQPNLSRFAGPPTTGAAARV